MPLKRIKKFRNFEEAREFVRSLEIKNSKHWKKYCRSGKKPRDIPCCPDVVYKNKGWNGFGDWLGTGSVATFDKHFRNFEEAREFVTKLGLKNFREWREYCQSGKKPDDIPVRPERTYKYHGWKNWGYWLGKKSLRTYSKYHFDFEEARSYVRKLNLGGLEDWYRYCKSGKKPIYIPSNPDKKYRDSGWVGYKDWLGNKT